MGQKRGEDTHGCCHSMRTSHASTVLDNSSTTYDEACANVMLVMGVFLSM
jgi:hypothetical protein